MWLYSIEVGTKNVELYQFFHFCGSDRNIININDVCLTPLEFNFILANKNGCWEESNVCDYTKRCTEIKGGIVTQRVYMGNKCLSEKSINFSAEEMFLLQSVSKQFYNSMRSNLWND
jgi:hypothetical protein